MSWAKFEEDCPGCRPVMIDMASGKVLPDSHPNVQAIMRVWNATTKHERVAWHAFTCKNARDPLTMALIPGLQAKMARAIETSG